MSHYRVSIDKHGESAIRLEKGMDVLDDVQLLHHRTTGWRANFYVDARNQKDAIEVAKHRLGQVSEPLYWHLLSGGKISAESEAER